MEPQWSKQIPSTTVCGTYYWIFVVYAVFFGISVLGTVGMLVGMKLPKQIAVPVGFFGLLMSAVLATLALFQYLVCARALLGEETVTIRKGSAQQ
jgi:hypothetical protein